MKLRSTETIIEQMALLFASFVWTTIVLAGLTLFWAYQDVQSRWEFVLNAPPEALAQAALTETPPEQVAVAASPSPTPWAGPGPTLTSTPTVPPSPTPTRVIPLPEMLPETLNADEPTPIPVIVHTDDEAAEFGLTQSANSGPVTIREQPTPVGPTLTQTVEQDSIGGSEQPTLVPTRVVIPATTTPTPLPEATAEVIANPTPPPQVPVPSGDIIPSRLVISSVGIDADIIPVGWTVIQRNGQEYSIWQVADHAVGWHKTTASLGQPGNTVMAGHHNVNGEVFKDLVNVEVGDKVITYANGQAYEYTVELKTIVKEKGEPVEVRRRNAKWISPTDDERLTFVTCWPYTNNTHRVIVVAKPAT